MYYILRIFVINDDKSWAIISVKGLVHMHIIQTYYFFLLSCTIDWDIHEFLKKDENRTIEKMNRAFRHILR